MTHKQALARAHKGAAYLDERLGRGWRRKIKRRRLDQSSGWMGTKMSCGCVLTQLDYFSSLSRAYSYPEGDYSAGAELVGLDCNKTRRMAALGFYTESTGGYPSLTEAWREVLRERPST